LEQITSAGDEKKSYRGRTEYRRAAERTVRRGA
jgi:hypothetical protein